MTRDHRRKKAVRAHASATGRTYLDAATSLTDSPTGAPVLAGRLRDGLVGALQSAGWPVQVEHNPQGTALRSYAGPAIVDVSRADEPARAWTGDEHPDDADVFDLATPLRVTVWAPLVTEFSPGLGRVGGVDAYEIAGDRPVDEIVAEIDRVVGTARRRDLADAPVRVECGVCGDRYAENGLFEPTRSQVRVCSCCAFDGDLLGARPAQLAFQIDRATTQDVAMPAGWAGAQVLLCCLAGPDLPERLRSAWRAAEIFYEPLEWWSDPSAAWIWLPTPSSRPAGLAELGCGASLAHLTAAIDRAHPDLRTTFRRHLDEEIADYLSDEYGADTEPASEDDHLRVADAVVDRIWPAAIAYTVAMLTQQADRPSRRSPWHVLESFELSDWITALDADLDPYHVETVLHEGILTVRDALDPTEQDD